MILPNKNIKLEYSLIGVGKVLLFYLTSAQTVSSLWEKVKLQKEITSFEKYILTLDFLYTIKVIDFDGNILTKQNDN